jgi:hypothetical protein
MTGTRDTHKQLQRSPGEYPYAIQAEGRLGTRVYDRLEAALASDGYTLEEASMLLAINLGQVLDEIQDVKARLHPAPKSTPRRRR